MIFQEISETCANGIKDGNKKIYLEKILKYLTEDIPPLYIWEQNGIPILLIQEVIEPYSYLQSFTKEISDNLVVVIKILYFLAKDDEVKKALVDANFHFFLFRYVTIYDSIETYELPRIWVLKFFSVFVTQQYVQIQIKNTEMVPIILKNIDLGSTECKIISIETFYNLISGEECLNYVTQTFDRFSAVNQVFNSISRIISKDRNYVLIKLVLMVYIRLCSKSHISQALSSKVPENVINEEFKKVVEENLECKELYRNLLVLTNKI